MNHAFILPEPDPVPDDRTLPPSSDDPDLTLAPSLPDPYQTLSPAANGLGGALRREGDLPGYEVLGELGRGGMGVVYKARQVALNRVVAVKMILAGAHADDASRGRFRAEAEAIAALQHPNIVGVYDVGEHDGHPYFSLEFCAGGSLEKRLAGTPLPPRDAAALVATLAGAVQAAHDAGVVHRDLKPANVLLTGPTVREGAPTDALAHGRALDGEPKITDFGLARRLDQDSNQTRSGAIVGTPSYMAPEQAGGKTKEVGPACDVWALGAILYECLTGRPPFRAATALDTVMQVVTDDPVPPSRLNARTPRDLETITLKCLQKEAKRRYGSAAEVANELGRFLADEPIRARPVGAFERAVKWVRRRPAVAALLLLAALLASAGVGGVLHEWRRAEAERDQAERQRDLARNASLEASERAEAEARAVKEADASRRQAVAALGRARNGLYYFDFLRAQTALKDGQPDQAASLLNDCPLDLRGWEWHQLAKTFLQDPVPCVGHDGPAWAVAWSGDGKTLVTGGLDGTLRVWEPATGRQLHQVEAHKGQWLSRAAFSPDGRWLASASLRHDMKLFKTPADWERSISGEVKLWDARTWREVRKLPGRFSVSFHPDGKRLATVEGRSAQVVEVETGRVVTAMAGHTLPVMEAKFTADGSKVISRSYDANRIRATDWDLTTPIMDYADGSKNIAGEVL
ncbi:MAG: serine/threonine-protein kinase, partial [Gemmataceae bacterium]